MAALVFKDVSHAYGDVLAVDDLSLSVAENELVCLLGPSGCGKTTALRVAAGLERLQRGQVLMDGTVVAGAGIDVPPEARSVGLVFQDYALFPHLNVRDNVAFGLRQLSASERTNRARLALELVDMGDYANAYPHGLSGGQQQRVALARALAPKPKVMLLDEPFSGLDVQLRNQIRDDTLHVLKQFGAATLMVTHDPEEAMFMADRIVVMRDGAIAQAGAPREIYFQPCNAFVTGLFGPANRLRGVVHHGHVETPIGVFDAPGLGEGCPARVLIRPEAVNLTRGENADAAGIRGRVTSAWLLGRSSYLRVCCCDEATQEEIHLRARVAGVFLPENGTSVSVRIDEENVFVFDAT